MARTAIIDPAPRLCPGGNRHRAARTFNSRCRSAGDSAIHALTGGPIGAMILGVMSGVTLGDTGRDLTANRATVVVFVLINAAAIVRIAASWNMGDVMILALSAGCWVVAFGLFEIVYGPMLLTRRLTSQGPP
jgi:uncharacterized protein involved in response to NO